MARLDSKGIIRTLQENKVKLREMGVKRIGLFGSYLRNPKQGSDLDFLVVFSRPTFDNYMELKFFLEQLFGKKVDLVVEAALKPSMEYVKKEAVYAQGV